MNELTLNIKINAPELAAAIAKLAAAMLDEKTLAEIFAAHVKKNQTGAPDSAATAVPAQQPAAPAACAPQPAPVAVPATPVSQPAPVAVSATPVSQPIPAPTAPAVPVASAPTYTLDQISKAGTSLVDAGKMDSLMVLLTKYGVQAVTQLQPAQYGVFATELRALGAQF